MNNGEIVRACDRMESELVDIIDQVRLGIGANFTDYDEDTDSKQCRNLIHLGRILTNASRVLEEVKNLQQNLNKTGE